MGTKCKHNTNPNKEPTTSVPLRPQSAFWEGGGSGDTPGEQVVCRFVWNQGGVGPLQEGYSLEVRMRRAQGVQVKDMGHIAPQDMSPALREPHDPLYWCCVGRSCICPVVLRAMQAQEYQIPFSDSQLFQQ